MFTTILVPLDGSSLAERALPLAEALAAASGGRLVLLRSTWTAWDALAGDTGWLIEPGEARATARRYLAEIERGVRERGGDVAASIVADDAPPGAIVEAANRSRADLIVMVTHARTGLERVFRASVAATVLDHSPAPVLLVHAARETAMPDALGATRLLVALDGSADAETVLPLATRLAGTLGADLTLLRAVPGGEHPLETDSGASGVAADSARDAAARYLRGIADSLAGAGQRPTLRVVSGDPATAITRIGQEHGATLVLMTTRGCGGLGHVIHNSVAHAVLRQSRIPLLVVPTAARRAPVLTPA